MSYNSIQQYKQLSINTMSKGEQLVLLLNEALKNLRYGSVMLKNGDSATAEKCTAKAKRIFHYLESILDTQYEVSQQLSDLYLFLHQEIVRAEFNRDAEVLDSLIPLVEEMVDTWTQAEKLVHMQKNLR